MEKYKDILVYGLGISGISTIKALAEKNLRIHALDSRNEEELGDSLKELEGIDVTYYLNKDIDLKKIDLIIKSPGIRYDVDLLVRAQELAIPIVTDFELIDWFSDVENLVVITGTNGKTSTSQLSYDLIRSYHEKTYLMGNIGLGLLEEVKKAGRGDYCVIEASSFQLEGTFNFKPKVGVVINIAEDHLDWHGSYEAYIRAKFKLLRNQDERDYAVLNYDDRIIRENAKNLRSQLIWFSREEELEEGIFLRDGQIITRFKGREEEIYRVEDLKLIVDNALAVVGIAQALAIDKKYLVASFDSFIPLEHRMEFVLEKDGISFYNDSKATNPESSVTALKNLGENIILIAGGYDKKVDMGELVRSFKGRVKQAYYLGQTADQLERTSQALGFTNYELVKNLEEALSQAWKIAHRGDIILLSPACASWDMYNNFQERGREFKKLVKELR